MPKTYTFPTDRTFVAVIGVEADGSVAKLEVREVSASAPVPVPVPTPTPIPVPTPNPGIGATDWEDIAAGKPCVWISPLGKRISFVPTLVTRGATIVGGDRFGMALNGEEAKPDLSNQVFIDCHISAARYASYFAGERNVLLLGCTLDVSAAPSTGLNDEAIIRWQDVENIAADGCRLIDTRGPKHAFRVHKRARNVFLVNSMIRTAGNGFFLGKYTGANEDSDVEGVEISNVTAVIGGPDKFNTGIAATQLRGLVVRNLTINGAKAADRG